MVRKSNTQHWTPLSNVRRIFHDFYANNPTMSNVPRNLINVIDWIIISDSSLLIPSDFYRFIIIIIQTQITNFQLIAESILHVILLPTFKADSHMSGFYVTKPKALLKIGIFTSNILQNTINNVDLLKARWIR